jgi:hypothetical protein
MPYFDIYHEKINMKIIPNEKSCIVCLTTKPINQFRKHIRGNGFWQSTQCIPCEKEYSKQLNATDKSKAKRAEYRKNNKEKLNEYDRDKMKNDPVLRLRKRISHTITRYLKLNNGNRDGSCLEYLPYSINDLYGHLESLFEPWMNWDNQGTYNKNTWDDNDQSTWLWRLDHIIPQSCLPYENMADENFKKVWALSNLRPLAAKQNIIDGARRTRHIRKII